MATENYSYEILDGPGEFDLSVALFRGKKIRLTVKKSFGDYSKECWECELFKISVSDNDRRIDKRFRIGGEVTASGSSFDKLQGIELTDVSFWGSYNARNRKGTVEVKAELY